MNRNTTLAAIAAVLLVLSAVPMPVLAADETSKFTADTFTVDSSRNPLTFAVSNDTVTHGTDGVPSWLVTVENGSLSSIEDWANASSDRAVLTTDASANWAVVKAPPSAVGVGYFDRVMNTGLAAKSYVTEIAINRRLDYAAPVTVLRNETDAWTPNTLQEFVAERSSGDADYGQSGIAYKDDAQLATLKEARNVTGSDRVTGTGAGTTVAVIDTGVNTAGGALFSNGTANATNASRILNASKDFIQDETVKSDGIQAVEDPNGHGSWVASSIAANSTNDSYDGYAPQADVLALRVLDSEGSGSTADIVEAVRYAADNNADVISMSLGSPVYSSALCDAIDYAYDNSVSSVVIAAGNSRQTTRWVASPADCSEPGTVSVAATNTTDHANIGVAYFSQLGDDPGVSDGSAGQAAGADITVGAPGMRVEAQIASTGGTVSKRALSGTSMAAPQVSGAILQTLETHPEWVGEERAIHDNLTSSARPAPNVPTREIGSGLLAVDNLDDGVTPDSQASSMTNDATARDQFWAGLSDASGGTLTRFVATITAGVAA